MEKIIIIRHGEYDHIQNNPLSDVGKNQMEKLAIKLLSELENKNIIFVCSIARRASESAETLQKIWKEKGIDLPLHKYYELWSGGDAYCERNKLKEENKIVSIQDFAWFENFIKESICDVLIAVTHLEFIEYFPVTLDARFGNEIDMPEKGNARILNIITKEERMICPLD